MGKYLDLIGLGYLIEKIQATFIKKTDTIPATSLAIDTTPTNNSDRLITSGGVKAALDTKQDTIDSSHKLSADLVLDGTTNKVYTSTEKSKLAGIASGAEVNVQVDWNVTDTSSDAYIKNKPTNVSTFTNDAGYLTQHQDITGKEDNNNKKTTVTGNESSTSYYPSISAVVNYVSGVANDIKNGIIPETVTNSATMTISPDVVTVIDGDVGTATITLQVPNDNRAHVWDILMTTDTSPAVTFAMSNSETILAPDGFSIGASKDIEISVIGVGTKYYLRYGEFA